MIDSSLSELGWESVTDHENSEIVKLTSSQNLHLTCFSLKSIEK